MAGHKHLTESEARRIWYLHKKGLKSHDIALAIEKSVQSVYRVVDIFTKAENKEWDALESEYGKKNKNLLAVARDYFGVKQQAAPEPAKPQPVRDNTAIYLGEVLAELRRNNELLEKLAAAWEVQL